MPGLTGGISLAPLKVELKADITGFKSDMEKARVTGVTEAEKISKSLENTAKTGERLSSVGSNLTKYVSLPLAGVATVAGKMAMDFEKSMGMVSTLLDGTTEQVKDRTAELSESVLNVSKDTGVAAKDISGGLYEVISAYGDTADSAKILEVAAKGAKASGASTTDTIRLLSSVTKGYGDTSFEANQKVADLAFLTAKLGQTTFPELASSIGQVVPLCENLKVSQEELFGVMATATGVTGTASEVSTQLKGVLQALMSPTESMIVLMNDLGYANGQAMMESLGLQGSINTIVKAAEDSGKPLQDYIGEINGQIIALALAGAQSENLTEKTKAMMEANGAATEAYEKSQDNMGAKFEKAMNKIMVSLIELGDAAAPTLEKIADMISDVADWFGSLSDEQQENILKWGGLAAAAGPVLKLFGDGIQMFTKLTPAIAGLSKGFDVLSGAGKSVTRTVPKATSVAKDLAKEVGGLPALLKPAAKEATELATAGGSIAKALPDASKVIEGVEYAIDGIPKAAAPAAESLTTVAGAAGEAATAVGGGSGLAGTLSNVLGSSLGTAAIGVGAFAVAAAGIGVGIAEAYKQMNADVVPEVDLFSETIDTATKRIADSSGMGASIAAENTVKISDATKEALGAYMELDDGVTQSLYNIGLNSENITAETTNTIFTNFASMSQMLIDKENETYNTRIEALSTFLTSSSTMEAASGQAILDQINQRHSDRISSTEAMQARLTELQTIAAANNGQLSREEQAELKSIQDQMREDAIGALTQTEQEAAVIRARIKEYQGRLSAEMASELIIKANEARDGEIKAAQEKRDGIIVQAEGLRRAGDITQEQYDEMVRAAQEGCDQQISEAERTCDGVKKEIEEGTPGILNALNIQTGEMLSPFEIFKENVLGIFNSIAAWWDNLPFNKGVSVTDRIKNSSGYSHSYNGVENVPYDGYRIYAHKDERLLTAEENAAYTRMLSGNSGGIHQEFNFYGDNNSPSEIGRAAEKAMRDIPTTP
ncbi:phage tail tape measure protein [Eubacterium limosum]|uniref:Phage tail tape measure protein n=1 Tax=Eubacterium limosum TaxID=1736 RepID=A0AAC9QSP6_EUBLI|nr:phage tail tape measure protein [Eubacterium limosum]ARD65010.1 phage tail tape measure protein [Eubacterium limosum]PWW52964.1 TP901 family phage tail tape measure protein [Eubacterium limosum]UQZ20968.1 phage tail tape measure protein [Eubacterium limosum]